MKNKLVAVFLSGLICFLILGSFPVSAESTLDTVEAEQLLEGILAYQKAEPVQDWINGKLSEQAGITSEWYILALAQSGEYVFTAYERALKIYLNTVEVRSASSRLKYALTLSAIGSEDEYISSVLDDSVGKQGVMSIVYGLHMLNNGYTCTQFTLDEVKVSLLSLQHADGGWSVSGSTGDTDVTAMAIQALAPYYKSVPEISYAIENALVLLSDRQLDNGGFTSYGIENPESAAQVLVALSSIGIDARSDERFIKNGNTIFDAIERFRLQDGSFSHMKDAPSNETATSQVFHAMTAYIRMAQGKSPLYILDSRNIIPSDPTEGGSGEDTPPSSTDAPVPSETIAPTTEIIPTTDHKTDTVKKTEQGGYKLWVSLIIISVGGGLCPILYFLLNKRRIKHYMVLLIAVAAALIFVWVTNFHSVDAYYNSDVVTKENIIGSVTLTIRCDTVVGKSDSEYIPSDGVILESTEFEIEEGDTVYDILTLAARKYRIQLEYSGNSDLVYITGINYLYELDYGDLSGWVYHVNDTATSVGCGEYTLSDGDKIEWHYSCELGNDIN